MKNDAWTKQQEDDHKAGVKKFFTEKITKLLAKSNNSLEVGDRIADILKSSDETIVKLITPRAVSKWASYSTRAKWHKVIKDPKMLLELRMIGKSIANSMRPLAGNNFALWVEKILNSYFGKNKIPLKAITSGKIKREIIKQFQIRSGKGNATKDYKPDVDIVIIQTNRNDKPLAIISAKTTLAERVMQTISWFRYLKRIPTSLSKIKLFLVTAWDMFESGANKERVQELDGVYVCNANVNQYRKIKKFSKIGKDLRKLIK